MQLCIVSGAITNKNYVGILFAACLKVIIVVVEELEAMRDGTKKDEYFYRSEYTPKGRSALSPLGRRSQSCRPCNLE